MIAETIKRSMQKAATTLEEARVLLGQGYLDGAVSRAYYAVVNATNAALEACDVRVRSHRALMGLFGLHLIKTGKLPSGMGAILAGLQSARDEGDYNPYSSFSADEAADAIQRAETFLEAIDNLLAREGEQPRADRG